MSRMWICILGSALFYIFILKGYRLRDNKNTFKKSRLSPDPVKRTGEKKQEVQVQLTLEVS